MKQVPLVDAENQNDIDFRKKIINENSDFIILEAIFVCFSAQMAPHPGRCYELLALEHSTADCCG